ncbi:hypothetical protein OSTOST_13146 [Ostertagia ostertagi]
MTTEENQCKEQWHRSRRDGSIHSGKENLQSSFQVHNVTMSSSVDVEMAGGSAVPTTTVGLPTRRVSLPRNDVAWKNISRFGAAASVFANNSTFSDLCCVSLLQPVPRATCENNATSTENKQCQADGLPDDWNVSQKCTGKVFQRNVVDRVHLCDFSFNIPMPIILFILRYAVKCEKPHWSPF